MPPKNIIVPKEGSLAAVILRIIGTDVRDDVRAALRRSCEEKVVLALMEFVSGHRGFTKQWLDDNAVRQTLSEKFPEGWTPENEAAFDEGYEGLPKDARSVNGKPIADPIQAWRNDIAELLRDLRVNAGHEAVASLATALVRRVFKGNVAAASRFAEAVQQIELADSQVNPVIIVN